MTYEEYDNYRNRYLNKEVETMMLDISSNLSFFADRGKTTIINPVTGQFNEDAAEWFKDRNIHPLTMDESDFYIFRNYF